MQVPFGIGIEASLFYSYQNFDEIIISKAPDNVRVETKLTDPPVPLGSYFGIYSDITLGGFTITPALGMKVIGTQSFEFTAYDKATGELLSSQNEKADFLLQGLYFKLSADF